MPDLGLTLSMTIEPPLQRREITAAQDAVVDRLAALEAMIGGSSTSGPDGLIDWIVGVHTDLRPAAALTLLDDALLAENRPGGTLAGRTITVESLQAHTPAATDRAIAALRTPAVVDTDTFRAILGTPDRPLSRARLYQLRDNPDFPPPIAPGVWLRANAEHYAETRNRKAGRPTTPHHPGDRTYCATCLHDAATHGITDDGELTGTPADGAPCSSIMIENGTVREGTCECPGYHPSPTSKPTEAPA